MGNVLRPARGVDDERLFPAGYIESVSSTNLVTVTDAFVILSDTSVKGAIRNVELVDAFIIVGDATHKKILPTITDISLLADRFPPVSGTTRQVSVEDSLVIQDTSDVVKISTSILTDRIEIPEDILVKQLHFILSDSILISDSLIQHSIVQQILTDSVILSDSINKKLDLNFVDQVPIVTDEKTARFHWVCVYAVSKIENSIGVNTAVEDGIYSVIDIEESGAGEIDHGIETIFNVGEINQLEDE